MRQAVSITHPTVDFAISTAFATWLDIGNWSHIFPASLITKHNISIMLIEELD
jgi:hypothetical protein